MQQLLFKCMQNWWLSQTHTFRLFISILLHAFNIPFPGDELLMMKVYHFASCSRAEIADFDSSLNLAHCSNFLIQVKPPSLWYLPVNNLNFWPWCLSFIIILFLCLALMITYNCTHLFYDTCLHPHSFMCLSIFVSDS